MSLHIYVRVLIDRCGNIYFSKNFQPEANTEKHLWEVSFWAPHSRSRSIGSWEVISTKHIGRVQVSMGLQCKVMFLNQWSVALCLPANVTFYV